MIFKNRVVVAVLFVIASFIFILCLSGHDQKPSQELIKVNTKDFLNKVMIIGKLGHPLGKIITVTGYWRNDSLDTIGMTYHVLSINGIPQAKGDIIFHEDELTTDGIILKIMPPFKEWDAWTIRGYETGRFTGLRGDIFEEMDMTVLPNQGFRFENSFVLFRQNSAVLPAHINDMKEKNARSHNVDRPVQKRCCESSGVRSQNVDAMKYDEAK